MERRYIIVIPAVIAAIVVFVVAAKQRSLPATKTAEKINIVASFYPLADFAKNTGGDLVNITNITPPGAEPHDFEPTPKDLAKIYDADLFILNGRGVDTWAEKIMPELQAKNITVIRISDYLNAIEQSESDSPDHPYDPHFWLDPTNAIKQTDLISDALIKIDSAHATEYNKNRNEFKQRLSQLDSEFESGLDKCKSREIITTHDAFSYLAKRYNLKTYHILGLSPEEEPSAKQIAAVANLARKKSIEYIFFETSVDQKLSQTIADEIGAQTLVLNPIESLNEEDINAGKNYISAMKNNLQNLKIALVCP